MSWVQDHLDLVIFLLAVIAMTAGYWIGVEIGYREGLEDGFKDGKLNG